jgi:RHS repeat-associated protein
MLPYRFTGKELDRETGLYYYGARYLDPRTSRWLSSDPAGAELMNPNRKGFSLIESQNWYSYTSNNPVRYNDPTGMIINDPGDDGLRMTDSDKELPGGDPINEYGCSAIAWARAAYSAAGKDFSKDEFESTATKSSNFNGDGDVVRNEMWKDITGKEGSVEFVTEVSEIADRLKELDESEDTFSVTGRALVDTGDGKSEHEIVINGIEVDDDGNISDIDYIASSSGDENMGENGGDRVYSAEGTGGLLDIQELRIQKHEDE